MGGGGLWVGMVEFPGDEWFEVEVLVVVQMGEGVLGMLGEGGEGLERGVGRWSHSFQLVVTF